MIETMLGATKSLQPHLGPLLVRSRNRRDRTAANFEAIGGCLAETAKSPRAHPVRRGQCVEMLTLAQKSEATVGDGTGKAKARQSAKNLAADHEVARLLSALGQAPVRGGELAKLEGAGVIFAALGASIRAGR